MLYMSSDFQRNKNGHQSLNSTCREYHRGSIGYEVTSYLWYTHKTSDFKTSGFKTSGFKTSGFKTSGLQNVRFTKRQVSKRLVSKRLVSKRPVFKFDILIKQKVFVFVILLLTSHYGDIWQKTSKIENKTQPSLCLQTWLQQNLRIPTNHKYRIFMDVFLQPDVLKTWRFVNLTFCKLDVL